MEHALACRSFRAVLFCNLIQGFYEALGNDRSEACALKERQTRACSSTRRILGAKAQTPGVKSGLWIL
jgi:hypothetical protein